MNVGYPLVSTQTPEIETYLSTYVFEFCPAAVAAVSMAPEPIISDRRIQTPPSDLVTLKQMHTPSGATTLARFRAGNVTFVPYTQLDYLPVV